jgi:hypothetical protein
VKDVTRPLAVWALLVLSLSAPKPACAQQADSVRDTTPEAGVSAGEADAEPPRRRLVKWNEYEGPLFTLRVGAGFLLDYATYSQDAASREQMDLEPGPKIRDTRLVIGGRIKTKRRITYQAGLMYDGYLEEWFVRQTGLMIAVPEAWGNFWIGRSKEGPSLNRVMTGYDGWTHERFTFSDAAIPLLADGIKWLGYLPSRSLIWNVGVFTDWLSKDQSFSYYHQAVAGRVAWVFGTEYYWEKASSPQTGDPLFHGGDIFANWLVTGETRSYNTTGGYFRQVSPRRTVFEGGPGAVELVLRFSYSDLNDGTLRGGTFWRLTPMANWHLSDFLRLELIYGVGELDRFDLEGTTEFFQSRLQLEF